MGFRAAFPDPADLNTTLGTGFGVDLAFDRFARQSLPLVSWFLDHLILPLCLVGVTRHTATFILIAG
jgi:hypothetical protein